MKGEEYEERAAIAQYDGGMSREEAEAFAEYLMQDRTYSEAPDTWQHMNRRWRAVVAKKFGQKKMKIAHRKLKEKHDVESFKDLTIGQIEASIDRIAGRDD